MRGDEERVVEAFRSWLTGLGWDVQTEVDYIDIAARRGDERLYAEAKGRTTAMGLDVDTLYGQLLRRMPADEIGHACFGVVVPATAAQAALRVPTRVREALRIDVYVVHDDGSVERLVEDQA